MIAVWAVLMLAPHLPGPTLMDPVRPHDCCCAACPGPGLCPCGRATPGEGACFQSPLDAPFGLATRLADPRFELTCEPISQQTWAPFFEARPSLDTPSVLLPLEQRILDKVPIRAS